MLLGANGFMPLSNIARRTTLHAGSPGETNEGADADQKIIKSDLKKISLNTFGAALTVASRPVFHRFHQFLSPKIRKSGKKWISPLERPYLIFPSIRQNQSMDG